MNKIEDKMEEDYLFELLMSSKDTEITEKYAKKGESSSTSSNENE